MRLVVVAWANLWGCSCLCLATAIWLPIGFLIVAACVWAVVFGVAWEQSLRVSDSARYAESRARRHGW